MSAVFTALFVVEKLTVDHSDRSTTGTYHLHYPVVNGLCSLDVKECSSNLRLVPLDNKH